MNRVDEVSCLIVHDQSVRSGATRQDTSSAFGSRSGQAMAEFLLGLVGIMVLVVGLQQISIISRASFESHVEVRKQLAEQLVEPNSDYTGEYIFVDTVDRGADQKIYTADDRILEGDDGFFSDGQGFMDLVDYPSIETYLIDYDREDPYYRISDSFTTVLSESFAMHYAISPKQVELVPFLRKLAGRDHLDLTREAWIPSWSGLIEVVE